MTDDARTEDEQRGGARIGGPADEQVTVRAAGEIDLTNVAEFQNSLERAVAEASAVTVDLTEVTYCDSATIRALFNAARHTRLTIQVSSSSPISEALLRVSGLDQVATVVTTD
jgi:anti-sigma B factor antagonist